MTSPWYQTAPPPYSWTRVRAFVPAGVTSTVAPAGRDSTTTTRPASSGRASAQRTRVPSTATALNRRLPAPATRSEPIAPGQVP